MLTTVQDFVTYENGSGIYTGNQISAALSMAEGKVESWLNTSLTPTQFVEEFPWPTDTQRVMLKKSKLISIDSVVGYYWFDQNTNDWQSTPIPYFKTINADHGIILVVGSSTCMSVMGGIQAFPTRLKITYTSGYPKGALDAGTQDGDTARAAVFECCVGFLQTSFGLNSTGNVFIPSFSIAGYSESRQLPERSGAEELINQHIQNAKSIIRHMTIYRPIQLRYPVRASY